VAVRAVVARVPARPALAVSAAAAAADRPRHSLN